MDDIQGTSPETSGEPNGPDYQSKYDGLQSAFQKRQNEWAQRESQWEAERAETAAKLSKLAEYELRESAEAEEAAFEERLMSDPRMNPQRHNAVRGPSGGRDDGSAEYADEQLAKALGTKVTKTSWP